MLIAFCREIFSCCLQKLFVNILPKRISNKTIYQIVFKLFFNNVVIRFKNRQNFRPKKNCYKIDSKTINYNDINVMLSNPNYCETENYLQTLNKHYPGQNC